MGGECSTYSQYAYYGAKFTIERYKEPGHQAELEYLYIQICKNKLTVGALGFMSQAIYPKLLLQILNPGPPTSPLIFSRQPCPAIMSHFSNIFLMHLEVTIMKLSGFLAVKIYEPIFFHHFTVHPDRIE